METILGITIFCFLIAAYSVFDMVREARKMRKKEDPVPFDDIPGQDYNPAFFEDVDCSERPFINYFN